MSWELDSLRLAEMRLLTLLGREILPGSGYLPMRSSMVTAASSLGLYRAVGLLAAAPQAIAQHVLLQVAIICSCLGLCMVLWWS